MSAMSALSAFFAAPKAPLEVTGLSGMGRLRFFVGLLLLQPLIVVGFVVHHRHHRKVLGQRRRLSLPLQARRLPWIVARDGAVLERPDQVEYRQQVADAQNGCAR